MVGITFSFLIVSPLINEVTAAMLPAMFGWTIGTSLVSGLDLVRLLLGKIE